MESSPWRSRNLVGTWGGGLWAGVLSLEEQELSRYVGRGLWGGILSLKEQELSRCVVVVVGGAFWLESSPWRSRNLVGAWGGVLCGGWSLLGGVLSLEEQKLVGVWGRGGGVEACPWRSRNLVGWNLLGGVLSLEEQQLGCVEKGVMG